MVSGIMSLCCALLHDDWRLRWFMLGWAAPCVQPRTASPRPVRVGWRSLSEKQTRFDPESVRRVPRRLLCYRRARQETCLGYAGSDSRHAHLAG
jgi:hypothetical protein